MFASNSRFFLALIAAVLAACGNRFDLSTERGRQARIDDANYHLSKGECSSAHSAIDPLYNSSHVDDEVRLIKASAYACDGGFELLTLAASFVGATNYFKAIAKSMNNTAGDAKRTAMYNAADVLTESGTKINASQRSRRVNTFMVFLQLGTVGTILRNYGSPATDGTQGANLVYIANGAADPGEMSNTDACALTASLAIITDSYANSSLSDSDTAAVNDTLNTACVNAGLASCSVANKDRSVCTGAGADPNSVNAANIVTQVNNDW